LVISFQALHFGFETLFLFAPILWHALGPKKSQQSAEKSHVAVVIVAWAVYLLLPGHFNVPIAVDCSSQ
jgi:hypothetical protein